MSWKTTIQPEKSSWKTTIKPETPAGDAVGAAIEGFGQGASLGYLPQLQALVEMMTPNPNKEVDERLRSEGFILDQPEENYTTYRDQNIARQAQLAETNPYIYHGAQIAGGIATAPAVEARLAKAIPLAARGSLALRGAATGGGIGLLQNPGDVEGEVSLTQIPDRLLNAGVGTVIGGGLGKLGSMGARAKALDGAGSAVTDDASRLLLREKSHAGEIRQAAEELGAPVLSGQTSSSKLVQNLEDMLQSSPSLIGQRRRRVAEEGLDAVRKSLQESLDAPMGETLASTGSKLKESISSKIRAENEPISAMYETLKESTKHIPISKKSVDAIARNIGKLDDVRAGEGFESGSFAKTIMNRVKALESVDDVKRLRTIVRKNATTPEKRAVLRAIDPKLRALEEGTVVREAKKLAKDTGSGALGKNLMGLVDERKAADSAYSGLMENLRELGGIVKKGKVFGPESFAQTIESMGDEEFARRILAKGNHKQLKFLQETFPDEAQHIFNLEKRRILDQATKDKVINPRLVLKELEDRKLSPEAQEIMFGKDAIKKFKAGKTYVESLPGKANPSGTETTRQVYEFFENPLKWAGSNARDAAILGILKSAEAGDASAINRAYNSTANIGRKSLSALDPIQRRLRLAAIQGANSDRPKYSGSNRRSLRLKAMGE